MYDAGDPLNGRDRESGDTALLIASLRLECDTLRAELAQAERRTEALQAEAARRASAKSFVRLPVLCRDLARWSIPKAGVAAVAVPIGPPPLPPTANDLEAINQYVEALRRLLRTPVLLGKPYHAGFDAARFQVLQAKLREAAILAEKLLGQVERSRSQKDLQWHLMVARRNDEVNRGRR
jgi:hypothetical protein